MPLIDTGQLFLSEFPQPPDPLAYFADEPGFEAEVGVLGAGDQIGAEALSNLLFWNGSAAGSAPAGVKLNLAKGPLSLLDLAGTGTLGSFSFATADVDGGIHQHLGFSLLQEDAGLPGTFLPGGPAGVYGLHLRLTSPQHGSSEGLLMAFNNGLTEGEFRTAATALAQQAGVPVPEPASFVLALTAMSLALLWPGSRRGPRRSAAWSICRSRMAQI